MVTSDRRRIETDRQKGLGSTGSRGFFVDPRIGIASLGRSDQIGKRPRSEGKPARSESADRFFLDQNTPIRGAHVDPFIFIGNWRDPRRSAHWHTTKNGRSEEIQKSEIRDPPLLGSRGVRSACFRAEIRQIRGEPEIRARRSGDPAGSRSIHLGPDLGSPSDCDLHPDLRSMRDPRFLPDFGRDRRSILAPISDFPDHNPSDCDGLESIGRDLPALE
jgi:hypothetical protein